MASTSSIVRGRTSAPTVTPSTNISLTQATAKSLPPCCSQLSGIRFVSGCRLFSWSVEHRPLIPVTCSVIGPDGAYSADGLRRHMTGKSKGMGGGAREGRWGVTRSSIVMASTNSCFNRGVNGTCVLVSIHGRCRFNILVRPIPGADHHTLFASFVVRAVSPKAKGADTTYSALSISPLPSARSSPLSPVQHIPYCPRPGTWAVGWLSTRAPMPPDEWQVIACPAGGRTIGAHTALESPLDLPH